MKRLFVLVVGLFLLFQPAAEAQEKKSMALVLTASVFAPVAVGAAAWAVERGYSFMWATPFAMTTFPAAGHAYLENYSDGLKFFLIKGCEMVFILDGIQRVTRSDFSDYAKAEWMFSAMALVFTYGFEVGHLVIRTSEINRKEENKVQVGFLPLVDRDQFEIKFIVNF